MRILLLLLGALFLAGCTLNVQLSDVQQLRKEVDELKTYKHDSQKMLETVFQKLLEHEYQLKQIPL